MRLVVVAATLWAVVFSYLAVSRHNAFESNAFDLGYVTQTLWNTAHGRPFVFTTVDGVPFSPEGTLNVDRLRRPHSLLAFHVEPILLLVAPLFALWSDPRLLLAIQSIALAGGAVATAALASRRTGRTVVAIVFGLAFLLSPSIAAAAMSDFHGVAFVPLLIPVALCLFDAGHNRLAVATAMLAALAREDAAILVSALGAYLFARGVIVRSVSARVAGSKEDHADPFDRLERPGLWLMAAAGLWAVLALGAIVPFFNGTVSAIIHHQPAVGSVFWHRYDWLGATPLTAARNVVLQPGLWIDWFARRDVEAYLAVLALTGGVVALFAIDVLAVALPVVLLNALSSFDWMRSAGAHYSVIVVPVLLFAGIEGVRRLFGWAKALTLSGATWSRAIATAIPPTALAAVLLSATIGHIGLEASPLVPGRLWPQPSSRHLAIEQLLADIPGDAAVAATSAVYPHVASRERAYWFPAVNNADYIAIDVADSTNPIGPKEVRARVDALATSGTYDLEDTAPGFLLFRRSAVPGHSLGYPFPERFYDFARVATSEKAANQTGSAVTFGAAVGLDGFRLDRASSQSIFGPSAVVTSYWHSLGVVGEHLTFDFVVTRRSDGAAVGELPDAAAEAVWYPPDRWRPGETIKLTVNVPRINDLQAIGVAVVDGTGARLPIIAPAGTATWDGRTIVRITRFDGAP